MSQIDLDEFENSSTPVDVESYTQLAGQPGVNTQIDYQYRDAGNYKTDGSVILEGEITPEQLKAFQEVLFDSQTFIAPQVGLPALCPSRDDDRYDDELDHELHDFLEFKLTLDSPTHSTTAAQLVERFAKVETEADWQFETDHDAGHQLAPTSLDPSPM
ncbi:hypothetical protein [Geopseudomonas aromaticivorans]